MIVKVYHFHNGTGGGVLSYIRNLINQASVEFENQVVYLLNKEMGAEFTNPGLVGDTVRKEFRYSSGWNFYYTCKKLAQFIPDEQTILVAHDWLELGMASHLGLKNKVAFILHGDYGYYYDLAIKHQETIDLFVAVSDSIRKKLLQHIPHRVEDIAYCRAAVPDGILVERKVLSKPKVVFVGRCTPEKGFPVLIEIARELQKRKIGVEWHIVGEDSDSSVVKQEWKRIPDVTFHGWKSNEEVMTLLAVSDYMLLPSLAEGMPLGLAEAMKCGVIPIVNDLAGGIQELIENGVTGYKIVGNHPIEFANRIEELEHNLEAKNKISARAFILANQLFDAKCNTLQFEQLLLDLYRRPLVKKNKIRVYGSRLDYPFIPNYITKVVRKCIH